MDRLGIKTYKTAIPFPADSHGLRGEEVPSESATHRSRDWDTLALTELRRSTPPLLSRLPETNDNSSLLHKGKPPNCLAHYGTSTIRSRI